MNTAEQSQSMCGKPNESHEHNVSQNKSNIYMIQIINSSKQAKHDLVVKVRIIVMLTNEVWPQLGDDPRELCGC